MAEKEWYAGCIGCIDFGANCKNCDYLMNNGHCRPCKADATGCACYSATIRPEGLTEEEARTWDTKEARRLLKKGEPVEAVAKALGASCNSLQAWMGVGMPKGTVSPTGRVVRKRGSRGIWDEKVFRELYDKGMTDPEVAERMGLNYQTVWKNRKRLGLPANGKRKGANK